MFAVDKGIPVPKDIRENKRNNKYPWKNMEIGDSFFVPLLDEEFQDVRKRIIDAASHYRYEHNNLFQILTRPLEEKDEKTGELIMGVRVWRGHNRITRSIEHKISNKHRKDKTDG